jgi:hypothetical protein
MPRRQCPGKKLGLSNVRLFVMTLLAAFDILPMEDENSQLTPPTPEFLNGVSRFVHLSTQYTRNGLIFDGPHSYPKRFPVRFRPRSDKVVQIIREASP